MDLDGATCPNPSLATREADVSEERPNRKKPTLVWTNVYRFYNDTSSGSDGYTVIRYTIQN
jgi:hypothetical protein